MSVLFDGLGAVSSMISITSVLKPGDTKQQQELEEIDEQLVEINQELVVINDSLIEIQDAINALAIELNLDTEKLEAYIQEAGIQPSISTIQAHYANTPVIGLQWFMQTQEENGLPASVANQDQVDSYASDVIGAWDIAANVKDISNALLGHDVGTDAGLLVSWSTLLTSEMGTTGDSADLYSYYLTLEQYYSQQLNYQIMGMLQITNAFCKDCQPGDPCPDGNEYYNQTFAPLIIAQLELFITCVEGMVLSQFSLAPTDGNLNFPPDGLRVLTRADLFAMAIRQSFSDAPTRGLLGRYFVPPSDVKSSMGPQLTPSYPAYGSMSASQGAAVPQTAGYPTPYWSTPEPPYESLQDIAKSDIHVIRYQWAWPNPAPAPSSTITIEPGVSAIARYYDSKTLKPTETPTDKSILLAEFVAFNRFPTTLTDLPGFIPGDISQTTQNKTITLTPTDPYACSNPAMVEAQFEAGVTGGQGCNSSTNVFQVVRTLNYLGATDTSINVVIDATLSIKGTTSTNSYGPVPLTFSPRLTLSSASDENFSWDSGQETDITLPAPAKGQASVENLNNPLLIQLPMALKANAPADLQFNLTVDCQTGSFLTNQSGTVILTVNSIQLYYDLPETVPS